MSDEELMLMVFCCALSALINIHVPLFFYIIYFSFTEWLFSIIINWDKENNKIALTFDDVPYGSHTEIIELIDVLDANHIKATFFIIADYVNDHNKQILVEAVKNGHQLGNHGKTNSEHWLCSKSQLKLEIKTCDELIKEIYVLAGVDLPKQMVYRPGCGIWTNQMLDTLSKLGYIIALGSVYPNDPFVRFSYINYLYIVNHIESGDVVILHDRKWTLPMVRRLISYLQQNNYRSVTLDELFH